MLMFWRRWDITRSCNPFSFWPQRKGGGGGEKGGERGGVALLATEAFGSCTISIVAGSAGRKGKEGEKRKGGGRCYRGKDPPATSESSRSYFSGENQEKKRRQRGIAPRKTFWPE